MCSIIGFKTKTESKHEEKLEQYLDILQERGDQSFGFFYITEGNQVYWDKDLTPDVIIDSVKALKDDAVPAWVFIHARKASAGMTGGTKDEQLQKAHPVFSDDETVMVLHNGTKSSLYHSVAGALSDSQALATLLSLTYENREMYYGDIGVVLFDNNKGIHLYKDGMRPLVMFEDNTIFASEPVFEGKWKNIKPTIKDKKLTDIILDFENPTLGLSFGPLVDIDFNIATTTVANFSVKGMPKISYCSTCKKRHIELKDRTQCCVCKIEGRKAIKAITYTKSTTNTTKKVKTVTDLVEHPKGAFGTPIANQSKSEEIMYTCDISAFRKLGIREGLIYRGSAYVKVDHLYTLPLSYHRFRASRCLFTRIPIWEFRVFI